MTFTDHGLNESYDAALAWLFARSRAGARRTAERAGRLLEALGLTPPPLTVVVVGTNGKGSVTNMTAHGLSASGLRTGRFLSPHVEDFGERIAVDGACLEPAAVVRFVDSAKRLDAAWPFGEETRPAFFEWTLALALTEFARARADACVLEAGVGGLHDATRAIAPLALTVLTNVDLDHLEVLGSTLEEIAHDKAGAFREGVPVVCGATQPGVVAVVTAAAEAIGAPLYLDPFAQDRFGDMPGAAAAELFTLPSKAARALRPGSGKTATPRWQANRRANARLAAAALRLLGVDESAVEAGLTAPALPGRFERFVISGPRGSSVTVVLDGAHDPAAAARLVPELAPGYVLLFGALARKQGAKVLTSLAEHASAVFLTEAARGEGPPALPPGSTFLPDTGAALDAAIAVAGQEGGSGCVLVAGSLYLAGLVRPLLRARGRRLPDPWEPPPG